MSGSPVKTEGVDISPVAVDNAAAYLEETGYPQSAAMLRKLSEQLTLGQAWIGGYARMEAERDALRLQLTAEAKRLDWLERNHTLHNSVAILYVVDGYEVQFSTQDGNNLVAETHGETLRDAIDKCMEEVP